MSFRIKRIISVHSLGQQKRNAWMLNSNSENIQHLRWGVSRTKHNKWRRQRSSENIEKTFGFCRRRFRCSLLCLLVKVLLKFNWEFYASSRVRETKSTLFHVAVSPFETTRATPTLEMTTKNWNLEQSERFKVKKEQRMKNRKIKIHAENKIKRITCMTGGILSSHPSLMTLLNDFLFHLCCVVEENMMGISWHHRLSFNRVLSIISRRVS